jgi:predicted ATPase
LTLSHFYVIVKEVKNSPSKLKNGGIMVIKAKLKSTEYYQTSNKSSPSSGDFFVPQIVLTGPPASGKTTALEYLKKTRSDLNIIEEAATQVLRGGFPLPSEENPWTQTWQNGLQRAIAGYQLGLEQIIRERTKKGIIQDRGLLDGANYLKGGVNELEQITGLARKNMLKRYQTVIYLGWLGSEQYSNESNDMRFEDELTARKLAETALAPWSNHPHIIEINSRQNRAIEVAEIINSLLPITP